MEPIRIAAVEDDRMLIDGLCHWTDRVRDILLVATAPTVETLLREAAGAVDMVDVVLLELVLRNHTDPAANVRRLIAAGHRVLVLGGWSPPDQVVATFTAGASGYLTKDRGLGALAEAVREIARGGTAFGHPASLPPTSLPPARLPLAGLPAANPPGPARPQLSPREQATLLAYASGLTLHTVARRLGIRPETARTYLERVKAKYRQAGRPTYTKLDLALRVREDRLEAPAASWRSASEASGQAARPGPAAGPGHEPSPPAGAGTGSNSRR